MAKPVLTESGCKYVNQREFTTELKFILMKAFSEDEGDLSGLRSYVAIRLAGNPAEGTHTDKQWKTFCAEHRVLIDKVINERLSASELITLFSNWARKKENGHEYSQTWVQTGHLNRLKECESVTGIPLQMLHDEALANYIEAACSSYMEEVTGRSSNA